MTIYSIDYRLNWRNSGIEYAQVYRSKMLELAALEYKFIYTDIIEVGNIYEIAEHLGFVPANIIYLHQSFSDIPVGACKYEVEQLLSDLEQPAKITKETNEYLMIQYGVNEARVKCHLSKYNSSAVSMVDYISNNEIVKRAHYTSCLTLTEHFTMNGDKRSCYLREFYNQDGSTALVEYARDEESLYVIGDRRIYGKSELLAYYLDSLELTSKDILLGDRTSKYAQALIQHKGQAKLGVVIHAEHYSKTGTTKDNIVWNNHYEYVFNHQKEIDFFIAATARQTDLFIEHMMKDSQVKPIVYTIPVGSLGELKYNKKRKPFTMMTASRLAYEKHIDWIVEAVAKAKKVVPELRLDIYGGGSHKNVIEKAVQTNKANDYIHLLGHQPLNQVYQQYELFVAASTSEGFGLTLMEAVGSGLSMIGFDVDYGNPTFIRHQQNGYLVPYEARNITVSEITNRLSQAIIDYYCNPHDGFQSVSYEIAGQFTTDKVVNRWKQLVEEVTHD